MTSRLGRNGAIVRPSSTLRTHAPPQTAFSRAILTSDLDRLSSSDRSPWRSGLAISTESRKLLETQEAVAYVVKAYHHHLYRAYDSVEYIPLGAHRDLGRAETVARNHYHRVSEYAHTCGWSYNWRKKDNQWFLEAMNYDDNECWTIVIKMVGIMRN